MARHHARELENICSRSTASRKPIRIREGETCPAEYVGHEREINRIALSSNEMRSFSNKIAHLVVEDDSHFGRSATSPLLNS
jgi:hypothetical protein